MAEEQQGRELAATLVATLVARRDLADSERTTEELESICAARFLAETRHPPLSVAKGTEC